MKQCKSVAVVGFAASLLVSAVCGAQEYVYRLDPELGVPYKAVATTETLTQTQMQGMDLEATMTMRVEQDVLFEAGADDTVVARYTVTAVSAGMGGVPGLDQAPFDLNDIYQGMTGVIFTMTVTRDGRVVEFGGVEEMMGAMMDRLEAPDELRAAVGQLIEANFGEDQVKQMTGQSGLTMPDRPVAVGGTWTDSLSVLGIALETTYTLAEWSDGAVSIEASGSISGADDAGFEFPGMPSVPGLDLRYEALSGSIDGAYEVDEATGLAVAYNSDMTMDAKVVMDMPQVEGQPAGASPMSIVMSVQTTVEGTLGKAE